MPEAAELEAPQVATSGETGLPPVSPALRDAFAGGGTPASQPEPQPAPAATAPPAETAPKPDAAPAEPDYSSLLKRFGVDSVDDLESKWNARKELDPAAYQAAKDNQRDDHDKVVRDMLADPAKAQAYFALQSLKPDDLAKGTPEDQRALLFENYKLANPALSGRLAELGFNKEFASRYGYMDSEDPADAEEAEYAKLQYQADLQKAAPAVKAAQEAAKVAALPTPAEAQGPTKEELDAAAAEWNKVVDTTLAGTLDYPVQVDGKAVAVAIDAKDPGLKEFLQTPEEYLGKLLQKTAFPEGAGKPANLAALAQLYARLMHPDAGAKAAAEAARANIGAHKSLSDLSHPAPDAPQPITGPGNGDKPSPGVLAQMKAISQGR